MQNCLEKDLPEVLELLHNDLPNCVYLYIDLAKYGLTHPSMRVWLQRKNNEIVAVVMKYYDSMQIYTLTGANPESIAKQIKIENVPIVTGTAESCTALQPLLSERYNLSTGWTFEVDHFRFFPSPDPIEVATDDDLATCAELICMDEGIGSYYEQEALTQQLISRRKEGMGRNYLIRKEGRIIAHIGTYAEFENMAVSSGLIVHPDYRGQHYGTSLESYLMRTLLSENKRIFSFIRAKKRFKYYQALGLNKYWHNGKLRRKEVVE